MSSKDEDSSSTLYETSASSDDELYRLEDKSEGKADEDDDEDEDDEDSRSNKSLCANTMVTLQSVINLTMSNMTISKPNSVSRQHISSRTLEHLKSEKMKPVGIEHTHYQEPEFKVYKSCGDYSGTCDEIYFFLESLRLKVNELRDKKSKLVRSLNKLKKSVKDEKGKRISCKSLLKELKSTHDKKAEQVNTARMESSDMPTIQQKMEILADLNRKLHMEKSMVVQLDQEVATLKTTIKNTKDILQKKRQLQSWIQDQDPRIEIGQEGFPFRCEGGAGMGNTQHYENVLGELDKRRLELLKELDTLEKDNSYLNTKIYEEGEQYEQSLGRSQEETQLAKRKHADLVIELKSAKNQLEEIVNLINKTNENLSRCEMKKIEIAQSIHEKKALLVETSKAYESLKAEEKLLTETHREIDKEAEVKSKLQSELDEIREANQIVVDENSRNIKALGAKVLELYKELWRMESEHKQTEKECYEFKRKTESLTSIFNLKKSEILEMREEIKKLRMEIQQKNTRLNQDKESEKTLFDDVQELEKEVEETENEISRLAEEQKTLKTKLEIKPLLHADTPRGSGEEDLEPSPESLQLQTELREKVQYLQMKEAELFNLKEDVNRIDTDLIELNEEVIGMKKGAATKTEELKKLQEQCRSCWKKLNELKILSHHRNAEYKCFKYLLDQEYTGLDEMEKIWSQDERKLKQMLEEEVQHQDNILAEFRQLKGLDDGRERSGRRTTAQTQSRGKIPLNQIKMSSSSVSTGWEPLDTIRYISEGSTNDEDKDTTLCDWTFCGNSL